MMQQPTPAGTQTVVWNQAAPGGAQYPIWNQASVTFAVAQPAQPRNGSLSQSLRGVGITLIILSVISFICNIVWLAAVRNPCVGYSGPGFWGGVMLFVTGLLAVLTAASLGKCLMIATMVLAILTMLTDLAMLALAAVQTAIGPSSNCDGAAFGIVFLVISLTGLASLIATSVLSCKGICGCQPTPGAVLVPIYSGGAYVTYPSYANPPMYEYSAAQTYAPTTQPLASPYSDQYATGASAPPAYSV